MSWGDSAVYDFQYATMLKHCKVSLTLQFIFRVRILDATVLNRLAFVKWSADHLSGHMAESGCFYSTRLLFLSYYVYYHSVDPQRVSDMAGVIDALKVQKSTFPQKLRSAFKALSLPVLHDSLVELPSVKRKGKRVCPPCHVLGVCVCGQNKVISIVRWCFYWLLFDC